MVMSPLADVSDLADWLGLPISDGDPRAEALLSAASAIVRGYTSQSWEDGVVPDDVRFVVVQVASRVWVNPSNLESISVDDATRRWGSSGVSGLRLEDSDKEALAGYLDGVSPDLGTLSIRVNGRCDETVYVPTGPPPAGYPFPWYNADDLP